MTWEAKGYYGKEVRKETLRRTVNKEKEHLGDMDGGRGRIEGPFSTRKNGNDDDDFVLSIVT